MADLSPEQAARYARQIMLAEVGRAGQVALTQARAAVAASAIATRYAMRAGFAGVEAGAVDEEELAPADVVRSVNARAVLAGARAVVREVRRVLDEERAP